MSKDFERLSCIALLLRDEWSKQASIRAALVESVKPSDLLAVDPNSAYWLTQAEEQLRIWDEHGFNVVTYSESHYPAQLRDVHDFPLALFWRGKLWEDAETEPSVAIVGSRDASKRAIETARWVAAELSKQGVSVVSGLARGIDTAAHESALQSKSRTVGVIGTGIDKTYPRENSILQESIASHGLLISQFKPGSSPTRSSFPMRNVVMSAFSSATLILEAAETSGTKHQAHAAVKHGRPLILSTSVVRETTWGAKLSDLVNSAEIVVAGTPKDALEAAHEFAVRPKKLKLSLI